MSQFSRAGEIADELVRRLKTITVANGAETDMGLLVMQGRRKSEDDYNPSITLIEGEDQPETIPGKLMSAKVTQRYAIVGYNVCDPDNPNLAAHAMLRDMKRAIFRHNGQADVTLGGNVRAVEYRGRNIGVRAEGTKMVMAVIEIDVSFVEDLSNP